MEQQQDILKKLGLGEVHWEELEPDFNEMDESLDEIDESLDDIDECEYNI